MKPTAAGGLYPPGPAVRIQAPRSHVADSSVTCPGGPEAEAKKEGLPQGGSRTLGPQRVPGKRCLPSRGPQGKRCWVANRGTQHRWDGQLWENLGRGEAAWGGGQAGVHRGTVLKTPGQGSMTVRETKEVRNCPSREGMTTPCMWNPECGPGASNQTAEISTNDGLWLLVPCGHSRMGQRQDTDSCGGRCMGHTGPWTLQGDSGNQDYPQRQS